MHRKEQLPSLDDSRLSKTGIDGARDSLSGYSARPRTDWHREALAVVAATATFLGAAYASWEYANSLLNRAMASTYFRRGTARWLQTVTHPAFRLALLAPFVSMTSSTLAGAAYGLSLGHQPDQSLESPVISPTIRRSVAIASGTFIAVTTLDPWRKALANDVRSCPRVSAKWSTYIAILAAASSGVVGGPSISWLFAENVMLFRRVTVSTLSWWQPKAADTPSQTHGEPPCSPDRTEPSA